MKFKFFIFFIFSSGIKTGLCQNVTFDEVLTTLCEKDSFPKFQESEEYTLDTLTSDFVQLSQEGGTSTHYLQLKHFTSKKADYAVMVEKSEGFMSWSRIKIFELKRKGDVVKLGMKNKGLPFVNWLDFGIEIGEKLDQFPTTFGFMHHLNPSGILDVSIYVAPTFSTETKELLEDLYSLYPKALDEHLHYKWDGKRNAFVTALFIR